MYIKRDAEVFFSELYAGFPIVAITGPRQSGKTTLARHFAADKPYVSLEDPDQLDFALNDPKGFLNLYPNGAIIDEVQNCPTLFSYLQTIVDNANKCGQFILTGSQQFNMVSKITQSLAGRVGLLHLLPLNYSELKNSNLAPEQLSTVLLNGMYPAVYSRNLRPELWYSNYIQTYIERDARQLINIENLSLFRRFMKLCAGRCGQLLNITALSADCGIAQATVKKWLTILEASYIIFFLQPHFNNFNKRLVKTPKLYFYDSGLCAWLLDIKTNRDMHSHSQRGALFESWSISEILKTQMNQGENPNLFFWRDKTGNEIDLIIDHGDKLTPIEIKSGETINNAFFKGLNKWCELAQERASLPILIYGGATNQTRTHARVLSWQSISLLSDKSIE